MTVRAAAVLFFGLIFFGFAGGADGQTATAPTKAEREAARAEANKGYEELKRGEYEQAIISFKKAEAVFHATPHLLYMARAHAGLGRLIAARDLYDRVLAETLASYAPDAFREAQAAAAKERADLALRIPTIDVVLSGSGATSAIISVDGVDLPAKAAQPIGVDPGEHTIAARSEGAPPAAQTVSAAEGEKLRVELVVTAPLATSPAPPLATSPAPPLATSPAPRPPALPPPAPPPPVLPRPQLKRPWLAPAIAAFSAGALGLGAGVITGGLSIEKVDQLRERCPDFHCARAEEGTADSARTLGTASTIAFVLGGVGVAAGIVLVTVRPGSAANVRASVGLDALRLEGEF